MPTLLLFYGLKCCAWISTIKENKEILNADYQSSGIETIIWVSLMIWGGSELLLALMR